MTDGSITTKNKNFVIKPLKLTKQMPVFVNKKNKVTLLQGESGRKLLLKHRLSEKQAKNLFKEDVIYESKSGDFLSGDPQEKVTIVNRLNLITNSCRTVAKYTNTLTREQISEKTSDNITRLIGQKNYDIVFSALCSVISQELRIRGMLALLTFQKKFSEFMGQTDGSKPVDEIKSCVVTKSLKEKCCQTDENCMDILYKAKQKKRIKRTQLIPYVVKDNPVEQKKIVIHPNCPPNFLIMDRVNEIKYELTEERDPLQDCNQEIEVTYDPIEAIPFPELKPHLKHFISDDSNDGSIGNLSIDSIDGILKNPNGLLEKVDQYTDRTSSNVEIQAMNTTSGDILNPTFIKMMDGSHVMVTVKPEDHFHIATPEILKNVTKEERMKLLVYQAYIDFKFCLHRDEDQNLPIHLAVLHSDVDLLRRHCLVLRNRQVSLDIPANNVTPLQMSFHHKSPQCTALLLQYGADPLFADADERSVLHLACESSAEHLQVVIMYCQKNARGILQESEELWYSGLENKTDEQLAEYLLDRMCKTIDNQGYTPLMVASKTGMHACVKQLIEASPTSVNMSMPNCGNTALYLAVGSACIDAENRGNKSKVAVNFKLIIQMLMSNGADPAITNHSGQTVNDLLTEFNIAELSMLVANTMTSIKYGMPEGDRNFDSYMLVKEKDGKVNIQELPQSKISKAAVTKATVTKAAVTKAAVTKAAVTKAAATKAAITKAVSNSRSKPIILENITLPTTTTDVNKAINIKTMTNLKMVGPNDKLEKTFQAARTLAGLASFVNTANQNITVYPNILKASKRYGVDNSVYTNQLANVAIENKQREGQKTISVMSRFLKAKTKSDHEINATDDTSIRTEYTIEMPNVEVSSPYSSNLVTDTATMGDVNMTSDSRNVNNIETVNVGPSTGMGSVQKTVKRKSAATQKTPSRSKKLKSVSKTDNK